MIKFLESWKIILKLINTKKNRIDLFVLRTPERLLQRYIIVITSFLLPMAVFSCFLVIKVVSLLYIKVGFCTL